MGYILPITHYQYQDYQNRVIKDKQNPYYIEKAYKVVLDNASREMEEDTQANGNNSETAYETVQSTNPEIEKFYSELTGKGQHFSESI
ncbi:hypothetical protein [Virgibacillus sp. DJP39]|uniref:hypothetical protein n=1 Tax=Virgibacillus sp. DJP39 TaxID=3409790 RepID=UPI003BB77959